MELKDKAEQKVLIMDLCLINKFSVDNFLEAEIKDIIQKKNHYIIDIYHINHYSETYLIWEKGNVSKKKNQYHSL